MLDLSLSLEEFRRRYPTERACAELLQKMKWPDGYSCPKCRHRAASEIRTRRLPLFQCRQCRHQASLTVDTVMEKSRTPLRKWFLAIYWMGQGACAREVSKAIEVTYKAAWLIDHKIRHALSLAEAEHALEGRVCLQEDQYRATSFSGSLNLKLKRQPLLAAASLSDDGQPLRIKIHQVMPSRIPYGISRATFRDFIEQSLSPNCADPQIVVGYCRSDRHRGLTQICRQAFEWMNETFCGLGPKHLQAYLDQYVYLFRLTRDDEEALLTDMLRQCSLRSSIPYPRLIRRSLIAS